FQIGGNRALLGRAFGQPELIREVAVNGIGEGALASLGAAKVPPLDHLRFDRRRPAFRLAPGWEARRAGWKPRYPHLNMESTTALANGCHYAASRCFAPHGALGLDFTSTLRETVPTVCQGSRHTGLLSRKSLFYKGYLAPRGRFERP